MKWLAILIINERGRSSSRNQSIALMYHFCLILPTLNSYAQHSNVLYTEQIKEMRKWQFDKYLLNSNQFGNQSSHILFIANCTNVADKTFDCVCSECRCAMVKMGKVLAVWKFSVAVGKLFDKPQKNAASAQCNKQFVLKLEMQITNGLCGSTQSR